MRRDESWLIVFIHYMKGIRMFVEGLVDKGDILPLLYAKLAKRTNRKNTLSVISGSSVVNRRKVNLRTAVWVFQGVCDGGVLA
jgi:hypothetical protein